MKNENQHVITLAMDVIEWHQKRVANCNLVIDNKDAEIVLNMGDEKPPYIIEADSEKARWIRVGMSLALAQFQPCPVSLDPADNDEGDCDDE